LNAFGEATGQAADKFVESPVGQLVRADPDDLTENDRRGEIASEARKKLVAIPARVAAREVRWTLSFQQTH